MHKLSLTQKDIPFEPSTSELLGVEYDGAVKKHRGQITNGCFI